MASRPASPPGGTVDPHAHGHDNIISKKWRLRAHWPEQWEKPHPSPPGRRLHQGWHVGDQPKVHYQMPQRQRQVLLTLFIVHFARRRRVCRS